MDKVQLRMSLLDNIGLGNSFPLLQDSSIPIQLDKEEQRFEMRYNKNQYCKHFEYLELDKMYLRHISIPVCYFEDSSFRLSNHESHYLSYNKILQSMLMVVSVHFYNTNQEHKEAYQRGWDNSFQL